MAYLIIDDGYPESTDFNSKRFYFNERDSQSFKAAMSYAKMTKDDLTPGSQRRIERELKPKKYKPSSFYRIILNVLNL
jgi:hypothetical protein